MRGMEERGRTYANFQEQSLPLGSSKIVKSVYADLEEREFSSMVDFR